MLRAGDHVFHRPSREKWLLACDEQDGEIICCGWPETFARASDCDLLKAATDDERLETLRDVARIPDQIRGSRARHQIDAEQKPKEAPQPERAEIVCLCGSTRFAYAFREANERLTLAGKIVLAPGCFSRSTPEQASAGIFAGCTPEQKVALDELHKRKIDLADRVLVLNVGGYVGSSTRSEIEYAETHGKPVDYLEPTR